MRIVKSFNSKSAARLELLARQHRSCLTESEARLWSALNAGQLGVCFRRQVPVGARFIADFCARVSGSSLKWMVPILPAAAGQMRAVIASSAVWATASFGSTQSWCFAICPKRSQS